MSAQAPQAPLWAQRCFHHADRPAAARCLGCGRYFCRECVTEHQLQVLCVDCLRRSSDAPSPRRGLLADAGLAAWALAGLWAAWALFYTLGSYLLRSGNDFFGGPT